VRYRLSLCDYNRLPTPVIDHQEYSAGRKSRAWAEAWGAVLAMPLIWVLGSVAAWLSAMPMLLQWGWLLVWRLPSE
jgi:hypothetical protein